jgi:hypothetical protein
MACMAMACLLLAPAPASAQQPTNPPPASAAAPAPAVPAPTPAAPAPPPGYQPGFIDAFGHFIGDSAAKLNSQIGNARDTLGELGNQTTDAAKGAADAAKNAVGAAKDTAGAIVALPGTRFVEGRERCSVAPNGAADCRAAADTICHGKGFTSGKILDTRSENKCPAYVWLSGHLPAEGQCPVETFVTRAACQ